MYSTVKLDDHLEKSGLPDIDFVKIDAEGEEGLALYALSRDASRNVTERFCALD